MARQSTRSLVIGLTHEVRALGSRIDAVNERLDAQSQRLDAQSQRLDVITAIAQGTSDAVADLRREFDAHTHDE